MKRTDKRFPQYHDFDSVTIKLEPTCKLLEKQDCSLIDSPGRRRQLMP